MTRTIVLSALLCSACVSPTDGSGPYPELPENRGTLLAGTHVSPTAMAWSPNGTELYYGGFVMESGQRIDALRAVRVSDKNDRVLLNPGRSIHAIVPTDNGEALYFSVQPPHLSDDGPTLRRLTLSSGVDELIATNIGSGIFGFIMEGSAFAPVANGEVAYLLRPRTVIVRPETGDVRELAQDCDRIMAVAPPPARDQVACVAAGVQVTPG